MIFKLIIILCVTFSLFVLIKKQLLNIDLFFPWFLSIVLLSIASTSSVFIQATAKIAGIKYPPLVVIIIALFLILSLATVLAVYITEIRRRQLLIIRKLALQDLDEQYKSLTTNSH